MEIIIKRIQLKIKELERDYEAIDSQIQQLTSFTLPMTSTTTDASKWREAKHSSRSRGVKAM